jgi:glycosyltransferase involved in cell wall biosynthesis
VGVVLAGGRTGWAGLDPLLRECERRHPGRVVLRQDFAESERALLYEAGDVVAFPTRDESFGMVILEAWAAGRPVVASDIGAVRSTVREGVDGELVPVDDPDALAAALADLLDDPDRAARMGRAGSGRLVEEFDWDHVVERWDHVVTAAARGDAVTGGGR